MTKQQIRDKFYELKKWGYYLKNFQFNKRMPFGSRGFCDLVIYPPNSEYTLYIEIKTAHDKAREKQAEFREIINQRELSIYLYATPENVDRLVSAIMSKQYKNLLEYEKPKK